MGVDGVEVGVEGASEGAAERGGIGASIHSVVFTNRSTV